MCVACPLRKGDTCRISGLNARKDHALLLDCWLGWHPANGTLGYPHPWVRWYGVPWPLRVLLWGMGKVTNPSKLPGCGCLTIPKDLIRFMAFLLFDRPPIVT